METCWCTGQLCADCAAVAFIGVISGSWVASGDEAFLGLAKTSVRDGCGVLRVFLRYAHHGGLVGNDLSKTVEWPQVYGYPTSRVQSARNPAAASARGLTASQRCSSRSTFTVGLGPGV
jgi:hypothetical protein